MLALVLLVGKSRSAGAPHFLPSPLLLIVIVTTIFIIVIVTVSLLLSATVTIIFNHWVLVLQLPVIVFRYQILCQFEIVPAIGKEENMKNMK